MAQVVADDLCIGCGLCEAVSGGRVAMTMTERGSLRPSPVADITTAEDDVLAAACPGVVAPVRVDGGEVATDLVWGAHRSMMMAWAAEPHVRFKGATGGVLTALGRHLIATGEVAFVLHVGPDPDAPTRSRWFMSETAAEVSANTGSRYGPTAPLAGLVAALDRGQPFALIAKPCDLGAVHGYATVDPRADELCRFRLAMVCGGQSRLTKTLGVLDRFGLTEADTGLMRYRGHGNPGPTRVESTSGQGHELTYLDMWADEGGWELETRCKLCPDALGECADIAAADAWPGGAPTGDDEGFNAVVVRTQAGERLMAAAVTSGKVAVGDSLTAGDLNDFQPHQVRKKQALAARYQGMVDAGVKPIDASGLRLTELGRALDPAAATAQRTGSRRRFDEIRSP